MCLEPKVTTILKSGIGTCRLSSSRADSALFEFLSEEIKSEKSNEKPVRDLPAGFEVERNGATLKFVKASKDEEK